jgi:hypothetical protein
LHGSADEQRVLAGDLLQNRQQIPRRRVRRAVQDDSHRAFIIVLGHQHHASREVRVDQRGRRDQELPSQ